MADVETASPEAPRDLSALRELGVRALSALVMVVLFAAAFLVNNWTWLAFVGLVALGVFVEWTRLAIKGNRGAGARIAWIVFGLAYIGLAASTLLSLYAVTDSFGDWKPMGLLAIVMSVIGVDVGAYLAGRLIGGPKIAPAISPSKTWAGLIGAILCATLIMVQFGGRDWRWAAAGPVIAIVAQAGDFLESWMKRRAGVKDSGALIPGHGGLFDRVDGLLAVAFVLGALQLVSLALNG